MEVMGESETDLPVRPTIATFSPGLMESEKSWMTGSPGLKSQLAVNDVTTKLTYRWNAVMSLNSILPWLGQVDGGMWSSVSLSSAVGSVVKFLILATLPMCVSN
jgi:hypothetical protein